MHLYRVKYIKCLRTRKFILEHECEWNLSLVRLFLAIVARYLNCLDTAVLAHPFWALATFPVCFFVPRCSTNRAPSMLSSSVCFFTSVIQAGCLQVTPIDLMALHVCLSTFPLSALPLIYGVTFSSPRESRYRCLWLFFFCCQLGCFSVHSTNAFTQATSIKLRNSFKGQCQVDLVQVYSLQAVQNINPTFSSLIVHGDFRLWSFSSPMHMSSWCCDERMTVLFLLVHVIPKGQDRIVGIVTCYELEGPGIKSRWGARFSAPVQTGPGAHSASYAMGTGSLSWG